MITPRNPSPYTAPKILKVAKSHCQKFPQSIDVWSAYLEAIKLHGSEDEKRVAWQDARENARGDDAGLLDIWLWGINSLEARDKDKLYQVRVVAASVIQLVDGSQCLRRFSRLACVIHHRPSIQIS